MSNHKPDAQYNHPNIDLFPPEFNELRRVLSTDFPMLWLLVGGMMAHSHELLIEYMNSALDTNISVHTHTLAQGCSIWLATLERKKYEGKTGIILPNSLH